MADYISKDNTYFIEPKNDPKDRIQVEIGDSKQPSVFYPQVKLMRWDNEVNLSVRLVNNEIVPSVSLAVDSVSWKGSKIEAKFYERNDLPDGGYEFEITALEKPSSNVVTFSLVSKGLDFHYQPPFTEQFADGWSKGHRRNIKVTETDITDADTGENVEHRPENVVGSYAVSHKTKGGLNSAEGMNYRGGKAFHIFRPKIVDAGGKETWGELRVDVEKGILTVTIPQAFLDYAKYPVKHLSGLTMGWTPTGATSQVIDQNTIFCLGPISPASNGDLTSITIDKIRIDTNQSYTLAIYNDSGGYPDTILAQSAGATETAGNPTSIDQDVSASIVTTGSYWLAQNHATDAGRMYYDAGTGKVAFEADSYAAGNLTANLGVSSYLAENRDYRIYGTYTAAGGSTIVPLVMHNRRQLGG